MQLKILSERFYASYAHCSEILKKENRPYACLTIELGGQLFAVPFRHHINHQYAFHTIGKAGLEINLIAKKCSPKTVRNHHSLISAVLGVFSPNLKLTTTLPQKVKKEPYIPSDEDVRMILEHAKDTEYEIPILLACYGLRRSEICALTLEDINGDIVSISKAMVPDENREWVIKSTKTTSSTREVVIPMEIADKIRDRGYIYKGYPNCITNYLKRTERALGIPQFSIHKLRHYFASKMSAMNVPEADIMRIGDGLHHEERIPAFHGGQEQKQAALTVALSDIK